MLIKQDLSFYSEVRANYGTELESVAFLDENKLKLICTELASQIIGELVNR